MIYYMKRNRVIDIDTDGNDYELTKEKDEAQKELFKVKECVVYAKLIWYDIKTGWHNEFVPIIQMDSDAECYPIVSIARDLTTACLKRLNKEFIKLKQQNNLEE